VARGTEEGRARCAFDDHAQVHHRHGVGDVLDHAQVVADEQVGDAEFALQVLQQVEDLRLHRHIQRRDRLVRDDQRRLQRERPRDAQALALAARKFVRKTLVCVARGRPTRSSSSAAWRRRDAASPSP
jgi:hypothetical protein